MPVGHYKVKLWEGLQIGDAVVSHTLDRKGNHQWTVETPHGTLVSRVESERRPVEQREEFDLPEDC